MSESVLSQLLYKTECEILNWLHVAQDGLSVRFS
jgi:hypothetical protein